MHPLASCNYSFDLRDPFSRMLDFMHNHLDYNSTTLFTFFAVNGAGNGNATTFTYIVPKEHNLVRMLMIFYFGAYEVSVQNLQCNFSPL